MGMYRFSVKHLGRLTQKAPVAKHVAYIMRDEEYGPAQAHVRYMTRDAKTVQSREDLVHKEAHNLPPWAGENPAAFFAAAEQYERANGRFSTTWEIALPRELSRPQQLAAMRDFLQSQFADRHPYAWAMHESQASDGGTNPHVHVIFSSRTLDGIAREPSQFFRRYNPEHPENGGAKKEMFFSEQRGLYALRQAWADVANWHLEHAGIHVRINPKNLREQGLERAPERRVAPYHSTQAKYQGRATPEWQEILRARAERRTEQDPAAALWEVRKAHLGITQGVTREVFLHRVAEQARSGGYTKSHEHLDTLREHERVLAQAVQRQELYIHRLHAEVMQEAYRERTGRPRSARAEERIAALLREGPEPRLDAPLIGNRMSHKYHEPGQPQYGEVHPHHQVLFWSHAEAVVAGFRRASTRHDGLGTTGHWEADRGDTSGPVTGRLLDTQRIGDREFALIERQDGEHALIPWQASMAQQRGQVLTFQRATGQLWPVVSLDDHVPSRGAAFRFRDRDRGMDVGF